MRRAAAPDIGVRARVLGYSASAAIDDYADGTHQRFGATTLELLAPKRPGRSMLTIYHDGPVDERSPWRSIGSVLSFVLSEDLLEEGAQVFAAAARGLSVEDGTP